MLLRLQRWGSRLTRLSLARILNFLRGIEDPLGLIFDHPFARVLSFNSMKGELLFWVVVIEIVSEDIHPDVDGPLVIST